MSSTNSLSSSQGSFNFNVNATEYTPSIATNSTYPDENNGIVNSQQQLRSNGKPKKTKADRLAPRKRKGGGTSQQNRINNRFGVESLINDFQDYFNGASTFHTSTHIESDLVSISAQSEISSTSKGSSYDIDGQTQALPFVSNKPVSTSNITVNTSGSIFPTNSAIVESGLNTNNISNNNNTSHFRRTPKQKNYPSVMIATSINNQSNDIVYSDPSIYITNQYQYNDYSWFDGQKIFPSSLNSLSSLHNIENNNNNTDNSSITNWWMYTNNDDNINDNNLPLPSDTTNTRRNRDTTPTPTPTPNFLISTTEIPIFISTTPTNMATNAIFYNSTSPILPPTPTPTPTPDHALTQNMNTSTESSHDQWMKLQHEWANTKNRITEENEFLLEQLERKKWGIWAMHAAESERQRRIQILKDIELEQELERKIRRQWAVSESVGL